MSDRPLRIIGAPLDLGASRRGTDMGPSAIRGARLHERLRDLGYTVQDAGNIFVEQLEQRDPGDHDLRFCEPILAACTALANQVDLAVREGAMPIVLGGDHSIAIGTVAGLARTNKNRGLLWFDAHADFNTHETSGSGNIHGMPVSSICGLGHPLLADFDQPGAKLDPNNVALVGLRSVDHGEARLLEDHGIHYWTMRDIDEMGMRRVTEEALEVVQKGTTDVHLSFDLDGVDPQWAPGTGTPVSGGMTYREAHLALEMASDAECLTSFEFVEVNPLLDTRNQTGKFTVELLASALGKAIVDPDLDP